jgi:Carboxypeptidase regulatory-like domain
MTMDNVARSLFAAGLLALSLSACDNGDLPPATKYASVKGTVTDATTHAPVANATIIIDAVLTATTDTSGTFTIDKVPSGIIDYVVRAHGYKDVNSSSNAEPGKPFELNVALQQPPL